MCLRVWDNGSALRNAAEPTPRGHRRPAGSGLLGDTDDRGERAHGDVPHHQVNDDAGHHDVASSSCDSKKRLTAVRFVREVGRSQPVTSNEPTEAIRRRPQRRATAWHRQMMVEAYQAGASVGVIAQRMNFHRGTVARHLKLAGVIVRADPSGTYKGTARKLGINHKTVRKVVSSHEQPPQE